MIYYSSGETELIKEDFLEEVTSTLSIEAQVVLPRQKWREGILDAGTE